MFVFGGSFKTLRDRLDVFFNNMALSQSRSLRVCKNCLEKIDWKGFAICRDLERDTRVAAFSIDEFFKSYGRTVR